MRGLKRVRTRDTRIAVPNVLVSCLALTFGCSGRIERSQGPTDATKSDSASAGTTTSGGGSAGFAGSPMSASGGSLSAGSANGSGGNPTAPGSSHPTVSANGTLTVLSTAARFPVSLAPYGGKVYFVDWGSFSNDGAVYGVDANGTQLFRVGNLQGPGGIAVNANGLYWAAASNLAHAGLDGSNIATLSSNFVNDPITLGPNGVYGTGALDGVGGILGLPFVGGPTVSLGANDDESYGLAADAESVYWTTFSEPMSIRSLPLAGGSPVTLATSPGPGGAIALDAHNVYWIARGAVMKMSLNGGTPTQLASDSPTGFLSGIAVDGGNVYWSTADSIMKVSVDGGTPVVLVTGQDVPSAVAVDDTSVYWANVGNPTGIHGTISRLTPR
jgi:hypothetical protein